MYAVVTIDDNQDITPLATAFSLEAAERFAAAHIMQYQQPNWQDIHAVFKAGLYPQVIDLWNSSRYQAAEPVKYAILDFTQASVAEDTA